MRLFIAVPLEEHMLRKMYTDLEEIRVEHTGVKWVRPEVMHITLAFLGDVPDERLGELKSDLDRVVLPKAPFDLAFGGFGRFPPKGKPRVLYCDVEKGKDELQALYRECCRGICRFYTPQADRPFTPHLTLGRVRGSGRPFGGFGGLEHGSYVSRVDRIVLYRSILHPDGPEYIEQWRRFFGPTS